MAYNYPYGNGQQLNLDWFLNEWKNLLAAWEAEKNGIEGALQAEIDRAEAALADVFAARDAAAQSATAAGNSADAAAQSATDASGYLATVRADANTASNAAQNAAQSESNAADSAQTAVASKNAAGQSERNAAQSEANANSSKNAAAQSAADALANKDAAAQSTTDALANKNAAAQSAEDAEEAASSVEASAQQIATNASNIEAFIQQYPTIFSPLSVFAKGTVNGLTLNRNIATFNGNINAGLNVITGETLVSTGSSAATSIPESAFNIDLPTGSYDLVAEFMSDVVSDGTNNTYFIRTRSKNGTVTSPYIFVNNDRKRGDIVSITFEVNTTEPFAIFLSSAGTSYTLTGKVRLYIRKTTTSALALALENN